MSFSRRRLLSGMFLGGVCAVARSQQLAHAGWRGNSITPEAWWKHAAFVRFSGDVTFAEVAKSLENMSAVSADSVLLPDLRPPFDAALPFDPSFGSEQDLDELLREASARRMHVLVRMPLQRAQGDRGAGEIRFWLSRGVAGFDLGTITPTELDMARILRETIDRFPGQRILMARTPGVAAVSSPARSGTSRNAATSRHDPITLHLVSAQDVEAGGQGAMNTATQVVEIVKQGPPSAVAESAPGAQLPSSVPALRSLLPLLLSGGAPVLDSHLLTTAADRSAVQQVLTLRSTHAVLRSSVMSVLATGNPGLHAWLLRDRQRNARGSLLLVTNNSEGAITLHLSQVMAAQGMRGAYLRPLLRGDGGMGSVNVETGVLPAGAALLAEVRSDSYAPSTALDPDAPPPGSARRHHRR
ncbi:hypothetical protein [Terriglobus roseus]|uniref:Uncharacterized protein n=1 Tax=Terriglobus roseus TaxID=392734 RepID=A0A1H4LXP7_9BACT|nr:hypothetical protein [Terriglobus roseus]SEB75358.1 hypothetical protein SAMN05443244_1747 [Terriglobus roseus]